LHGRIFVGQRESKVGYPAHLALHTARRVGHARLTLEIIHFAILSPHPACLGCTTVDTSASRLGSLGMPWFAWLRTKRYGCRQVCMSPLKERTFDPKTLPARAGLGRTILQYRENKVIFAQGDPCDSVFCIQVGWVKLTVRSMQVKEATIARLGAGNFLGEAKMNPVGPGCAARGKGPVAPAQELEWSALMQLSD
jgi:hypothetical protein